MTKDRKRPTTMEELHEMVRLQAEQDRARREGRLSDGCETQNNLNQKNESKNNKGSKINSSARKVRQKRKQETPIDMANPEAGDYSIEALGRRIRIARIRRNVSLETMAFEAGFNRNTISALERGHAGTSLAVCWAVLKVLEQHEALAKIADPDEDGYGKSLEAWWRRYRTKPIVRPYER